MQKKKKKKKKLALNSGIQTNQILTNDDEVCIPCLSSILLAVQALFTSSYISLPATYHAKCYLFDKIRS